MRKKKGATAAKIRTTTKKAERVYYLYVKIALLWPKLWKQLNQTRKNKHYNKKKEERNGKFELLILKIKCVFAIVSTQNLGNLNEKQLILSALSEMYTDIESMKTIGRKRTKKASTTNTN